MKRESFQRAGTWGKPKARGKMRPLSKTLKEWAPITVLGNPRGCEAGGTLRIMYNQIYTQKISSCAILHLDYKQMSVYTRKPNGPLLGTGSSWSCVSLKEKWIKSNWSKFYLRIILFKNLKERSTNQIQNKLK